MGKTFPTLPFSQQFDSCFGILFTSPKGIPAGFFYCSGKFTGKFPTAPWRSKPKSPFHKKQWDGLSPFTCFPKKRHRFLFLFPPPLLPLFRVGDSVGPSWCIHYISGNIPAPNSSPSPLFQRRTPPSLYRQKRNRFPPFPGPRAGTNNHLCFPPPVK